MSISVSITRTMNEKYILSVWGETVAEDDLESIIGYLRIAMKEKDSYDAKEAVIRHMLPESTAEEVQNDTVE